MAFYAVSKGFKTGIYNTWEDTQKQVNGYKGALFKKFKTRDEAIQFIGYDIPIYTEKEQITENPIEQIEKPIKADQHIGQILQRLQQLHQQIEENLQQICHQVDEEVDHQTEQVQRTEEAHAIVQIKEEEPLIVFTDGSCRNNGRKTARGAYAVVWPHYDQYNYSSLLSLQEQQTNNRAEYHAVISALQIASVIDPSLKRPLIIYTDSQLLISSLTLWITKWKANCWTKSNGMPVSNVDLLKELDTLMQTRIVKFEHVMAHTGGTDFQSYWNNVVDKMAFSTNTDRKY